MKITYFNNAPVSLRQDIDHFLDLWHDKSETITINTSGSTGKPKSIRVRKNAMIQSARMTGHFFGFKPGQSSLLALSTKYIAGMMQVVRALEFNLELIVTPVSGNPLLEVIDQAIDFAAFVPFQVEQMLSDTETKNKYAKIRNVIIGGAPVNHDLEAKIGKLENHNFATFGMTETVSHVALRKIGHSQVYKALPSIQFSSGSEGRLIIHAPQFSESELVTNDCADLTDEYHFRWLGRLDYVINSGGIKMHPEMIEKKLVEILADLRYYIIGEADLTLGEKVVLVIEGEPFQKGKMDLLLSKIKDVLEKYEVPKDIVFMKNFQETATGKIVRLLPE